jgi:spermidine synthase
VIPWVQLDKADAPGGGEALRLMRRGTEFSIMLGATELMNSRLTGSEEALATLACGKLAATTPRLLIGGLGMGFTLRAALRALNEAAVIVVAELSPEVVAWARGPMAEIFAGCLEDARVSVVEADVAQMLGPPARFDAILLDVDNGPEGLTRKTNDRLYDARGLRAARAALRPGGVLAVWSQGPDDGFARRLRHSGFAVEERRVRANAGRRGARHVVWLASKIDAAQAER